MTSATAADLQRYLQSSREGLLRALAGLSEYDVRRPMTPSATNLLGLVKHLTGIELGYLGDCVGRPSPIRLPWVEDGTEWEGADMWAKADESREYVVGLYHQAWRHTDETLTTFPLDTPATVPWWPADRRTTTLGSLAVRVLTDTAQHAGHADIIRETIDGRGGQDSTTMGDETWWQEYRSRVQSAADAHR